MPELNMVVAALDGGDTDREVLALASHVASAYPGARTWAAHVVPPIAEAFAEVLFPYACLGDDRRAIEDELVKHATERMRPAVERVFGQDRLQVAYGAVNEALLDMQGRLGPDVWVVGAVGADRSHTLRLGHVAERLTVESPRPVLLCRYRKPANVKRIVVGIDLTLPSRALLSYALGLAHALGAQVQPVHVVPTSSSADRAGVCGSSSDELPKKVHAEVVRLQKQLLTQLEIPFQVAHDLDTLLSTFEVKVGDPADELVELAGTGDDTLLIVGRSATADNRLGRVAREAMRRAPAHTLVIPFEAPGEA